MRAIIISKTLPPSRTMIVCVCRRVYDKSIAQAARCGMSFDDIQIDMGVGMQCGQCESSEIGRAHV
jgi:bacterioferritin-associated ferredoxin